VPVDDRHDPEHAEHQQERDARHRSQHEIEAAAPVQEG
jgi:hypothetical protein